MTKYKGNRTKYKGNRSAEYVEEDKYSKTLRDVFNTKRMKVILVLYIIAILLFVFLLARSAYSGDAQQDEVLRMLEGSIILMPWKDTRVIFLDRSSELAPAGNFIVFIGKYLPGGVLAFHGEVIKDK